MFSSCLRVSVFRELLKMSFSCESPLLPGGRREREDGLACCCCFGLVSTGLEEGSPAKGLSVENEDELWSSSSSELVYVFEYELVGHSLSFFFLACLCLA